MLVWEVYGGGGPKQRLKTCVRERNKQIKADCLTKTAAFDGPCSSMPSFPVENRKSGLLPLAPGPNGRCCCCCCCSGGWGCCNRFRPIFGNFQLLKKLLSRFLFFAPCWHKKWNYTQDLKYKLFVPVQKPLTQNFFFFFCWLIASGLINDVMTK